MWVKIGNDQAVENVRDEQGNGSVVELKGQHVTHIEVPDDCMMSAALGEVLASISMHMSGGRPAWVEGSNAAFVEMLRDHFRLSATQTRRPPTWGATSTPALLMMFVVAQLWLLNFMLALRTSGATKRCKKCSKTKSITNFGHHPQTRDRRRPECNTCHADRMRAYRKRRLEEDPEVFRRQRQATIRKYLYGITQEQYDAMLEAQGGGCAICGSPESGIAGRTTLLVDHDRSCCPGDRTCGKCVRGILCNPCNVGLGRFKDSPSLLERAAAYVGLGALLPLALLHWGFQLRTRAGRDWQARVMGDTASTGTGNWAPANWIGVSADSAVPLDTDTVLAGEITVGTLGRAQATFAHTNGTASYTLVKSFTSDQTITLRKAGAFNAPAGGTMAFADVLDSPAPLNSGDSTQITMTCGLGA